MGNIGKKRVPVTLIVHTFEEVPEDWNEESTEFFIEENHCLGNYFAREKAEIEAHPSSCNVCNRGVALLGHIDLDAAGKLERKR